MKNIILNHLAFAFAVMLVACNHSQGQKLNKAAKVETHGVVPINEYIKDRNVGGYEVATLAGGCFWCTEAALDRIEGVVDVYSGYSGGKKEYPTYSEVSNKRTEHAEAIQVYYDASVVPYETLLDVLFTAHDPTQLNRQGNDIGPQYRSAIFYHNTEQKAIAEKKIKELDASGKFGKPIVTELAAYKEFWVAEGFHQNYYELNPTVPYVYHVSRKKVEKVEKGFKEILKKTFQ